MAMIRMSRHLVVLTALLMCVVYASSVDEESASRHQTLKKVASSMLQGWRRSDIADISPTDAMHLAEMKRNDELAVSMKAEITAGDFPVEENDEMNEPSLLEVNADSTDKWSFLNMIKKASKSKGLAKKVPKKKKSSKQEDPHAQATEDCMGCRFIWHQVEMDVANARYVEDVQASFEHNCLDAQKTEVFFKVCEDMYDDMYAMADDYMSNSWSVEEMCQRAKLCISSKAKKKK